MSSRYSSIEIKVGLFLAFSLALFVGMLVNFGRFWAALGRERSEILVAFEDVGGLKLDAPVRLNGVEVGRVKWMHVLQLDDAALERLPPLTRRDLVNLPLRPESVLRQMRDCSDADFDSLLRRSLKDRTMIELCLEVVGDDVRHYHIDDRVRVVTTVFGDAAVEIVSGIGAFNTEHTRLLLGLSGDFFTNLARSMGDVKDILSSVTDVVGTEERKSFERAQERFAPMSEKLDAIATMASRRAAETMRKVDKLGGNVDDTLARTQDILRQMQPRVKEAGDRIRSGFTAMQGRMDEVQQTASKAGEEISADKNAIRKDMDEVIAQSRPNFGKMRSNIREVYDIFGGLSLRLDGMRDRAGSLMLQSEPDLQRAGTALKSSLRNLQLVGIAANENKDLMISLRDEGEYEYATVELVYRDMAMAARRAQNAFASLQETAADLQGAGAEEPLQDARAAMASLLQMRAPLDGVRNRIEEKMLAPYERKKSAWAEDPAPAK